MKNLCSKVLCLTLFAVIIFCGRAWAANRYWVHKTVYQNSFSTPAELAEWQLIEDDGTGGFALSGTGTAILTMDDAAGGFANRLFSINGASPRLLPFDLVNGRAELFVKSITGGNQRIFLQAQEFDGASGYLGQVDILPAQSATGFFSVDLSSVIWDPSTVQIRFIVGGENFSALQGTAEFAYFSYSNTDNNWSNPANWSTASNGAGGASVPGAGDDVLFDGAGGSNGSCLLDVNASISSMQVTNGYSGNIDLQDNQMIIGSGGVNLAGGGITGDIQNILINGSVTITGGAFKNSSGSTYVSGDVSITGGVLDFGLGTVVFNGPVDQQFNSTVITPINNLVINKTSGAINFNSDILVSDSLVLTQGILNMNGSTIHLGIAGNDTGTLVTGLGKVNGAFARWISPASAGTVVFPLGNTVANAPMAVTLVTPPSTGGTITGSYTDAPPGFTAVNFLDNTTTILQRSDASWALQTSGITDGVYSLSLSDDHLTAISNLPDLHLTLAGGVAGTHQPATGTLSDPVVNRSGLSAADLAQTFYVSSSSATLPVTWLDFTVSQQGEQYTWNWTVALEENIAYYLPQYSVDGTNFLSAGKLTQLNASHAYQFTAAIAQTGTILFRVLEVDLDGKKLYSATRSLLSAGNGTFSLYPSPATDAINFQLPYVDGGSILVEITDSRGRIMLRRTEPASSVHTVALASFAAGSYYLQVINDRNESLGVRPFIKVPR